MLLKSVRLATIVMVALCLLPAGAHFFELANKMSLSSAEYIAVQKIYAGWSPTESVGACLSVADNVTEERQTCLRCTH